jgi:hypothetical protein
MANPPHVALLQSLKYSYFRLSPHFGPLQDDFSKIWPSSRFELAMAALNFMITLKNRLENLLDWLKVGRIHTYLLN